MPPAMPMVTGPYPSARGQTKLDFEHRLGIGASMLAQAQGACSGACRHGAGGPLQYNDVCMLAHSTCTGLQVWSGM